MAVKLHAIINPKTGEAEFEVEGLAGKRCTSITEALQAGHEVQDEQYTEEYYEPQEMPQWIEEE